MNSPRIRAAAVLVAAVISVTALIGGVGGPAGAAPRVTDPNTAFITRVYALVFGPSRVLDESGRAYWSAKLDGGSTKASVADQIARTREANKVAVTSGYLYFLGRPVDPTGLATYTGYLNSGSPASYVANRLSSSPEAYAHAGGTAAAYVEYLYTVFLGRSASPADEAFWSARMPDPLSSLQRKGVSSSLARSGEATRLAIARAAELACGSPTLDPTMKETIRARWSANGNNLVRLTAVTFALVCPTSV